MVADTEELEEMDALELHDRRAQCKESVNEAKKGKLHLRSRRFTFEVYGFDFFRILLVCSYIFFAGINSA